MRSRKPIGLALIAAVAALATMAVAAPAASATAVTPENTVITAKLVAETGQVNPHSKFYLDNGYSTEFVSCQKSEAKFKTPAGGKANQWANTNQPNTAVGKKVGGGELAETHSQGQGSVSSQVEAVSFTECTVRLSEEQGNQGVQVAVAAVEVPTPTKWTIAAEELEVEGKQAVQMAVGVPQAGVVIKVAALECELVVGKTPAGGEQQTVVMGNYDNTSHKVRLDGQIKYRAFKTGGGAPAGACKTIGELPAPAQYEATYEASNELKVTQEP